MTPLSLLAAQKLLAKLTLANALGQQMATLSAVLTSPAPAITAEQVFLSSSPPEMADRNLQMSYPRVCVYSNSIKNTQIEKFRSFSGQVGLVAEIWASADLINQADEWIHFYVESVADILQSNIGDWCDGIFYSGEYEVQFQPPKAGGLGFVESAKLTFSLNVSLS